MAEIFSTNTSLTVLMQRTARLNLVALPGKGHQGQDEIRLAGEDFSRVVRSPKQWDAVLSNLERPGTKPVSSKDWGKEEDEDTGVMVNRSRCLNWG